MSIVDKEVKSVHHFSIIANQGHLDSLLNDLGYGLLCSLLLLQKLHLHLFLGFFEKELSLSNHLFTFLQSFLNLIGLLQNADIVAIRELVLLLSEKLCADVSFLIQFFRLKLHVDEVCVFEKA